MQRSDRFGALKQSFHKNIHQFHSQTILVADDSSTLRTPHSMIGLGPDLVLVTKSDSVPKSEMVLRRRSSLPNLLDSGLLQNDSNSKSGNAGESAEQSQPQRVYSKPGSRERSFSVRSNSRSNTPEQNFENLVNRRLPPKQGGNVASSDIHTMYNENPPVLTASRSRKGSFVSNNSWTADPRLADPVAVSELLPVGCDDAAYIHAGRNLPAIRPTTGSSHLLRQGGSLASEKKLAAGQAGQSFSQRAAATAAEHTGAPRASLAARVGRALAASFPCVSLPRPDDTPWYTR